jgi:hypothetical protein
MKRTTTIVAIVLVFFAAGCGRHSANVDGSANSTPAAESSSGTSFSLRLAGVDKGDFVSALMRIKAVQVTSGPALLASTLKTPEVDLAEMGQAYLMTSFDVPANTEDVDFLVSFEGGTVSTEKESFTVDSRCQTLRIAGKVSRIAERKHAVIHLDLARSFVASAAGVMLVPHFQLVY